MLNSPTNAQRLPPSQSGQIGAKVAEAINMRVSKIKGQRGIPQCPYFMVRSERVELPTYWFVASCSIQLSYERVEGVIYLQTGGRSIPLLPPLPPLCLGTYRSPQLPVMPPSDVSLFFAISALSLARSSSTPLVARTLSISFSV